MQIKHLSRLWWVCVFVAWCFDFLFWKKAPGVSFFVIVVLTLAAGLLLALGEGRKPAARAYILLPVILFFAAMTFLRLEPFTQFINVLLVLVTMTLLALTFQSGLWMRYSLSDDVAGAVRLGLHTLVGAGDAFLSSRKANGNGAPAVAEGTAPRRFQIAPIIRGLLLALPVVFVLAALLASADPIFSSRLGDFVKLLAPEKWGEYAFRVFYILILAYLLAGALLYALNRSQNTALLGLEKPWLSPFLGWTEAVIILGAVDLLFLFFVTIQFQYFFGGQVNIHLDGYTYAEYARRGFNELVAVACISLLIFLGLTSITKREQKTQRRSFTGLGVGLVALVAVILVSAFQRLLLYEAAYGFTRLRTYTHVYIIWLGVLLVVTAALELVGKARAFGLAALLVALGFGLTLNVMNVDGFIVRQNVARAAQGQELDVPYLVSLSSDSVPELAAQFQRAGTGETRELLGAALACRARLQSEREPDTSWQSYQAAQARERSLLANLQPELKGYTVARDDVFRWTAKWGARSQPCFSDRGFMD